MQEAAGPVVPDESFPVPARFRFDRCRVAVLQPVWSPQLGMLGAAEDVARKRRRRIASLPAACRPRYPPRAEHDEPHVCLQACALLSRPLGKRPESGRRDATNRSGAAGCERDGENDLLADTAAVDLEAIAARCSEQRVAWQVAPAPTCCGWRNTQFDQDRPADVKANATGSVEPKPADQ